MSSVFKKPQPKPSSRGTASTKTSTKKKVVTARKKGGGLFACCKNKSKSKGKSNQNGKKGVSSQRSSKSRPSTYSTRVSSAQIKRASLITKEPVKSSSASTVSPATVSPKKLLPKTEIKKVDKRSDIARSHTEDSTTTIVLDTPKPKESIGPEQELTVRTFCHDGRFNRIFSYCVSAPQAPSSVGSKTSNVLERSSWTSGNTVETPKEIRHLMTSTSGSVCRCDRSIHSLNCPSPESSYSDCSCWEKSEKQIPRPLTSQRPLEQAKRDIRNKPAVQEKLARTESALRDAQQAIRKLTVLAGKQLLPDIPNFDAETAVILAEMDVLMERLQQLSSKN